MPNAHMRCFSEPPSFALISSPLTRLMVGLLCFQSLTGLHTRVFTDVRKRSKRVGLQRNQADATFFMAEVLAREAATRRRVIEEVYLNPRTGLGSIAHAFKAAKERNPFVTRDEVMKSS